MQATNRVRHILAALFILVVAATLIGATVWTPAKEAPVAAHAVKTKALAPMVGSFTGEFDNGVPIYRLPSITITTSRSAELARIAQGEQIATK